MKNISFKDRLITAIDIIFDSNLSKHTKALYCPYCKGNRFIDLHKKERKTSCEYECECVKCGAKVLCAEVWRYK